MRATCTCVMRTIAIYDLWTMRRSSMRAARKSSIRDVICRIISEGRKHMTNNDSQCVEHRPSRPQEAASNDPEVLRAALIREAAGRGRAECIAKMQGDVVKHALDLLVREP